MLAGKLVRTVEGEEELRVVGVAFAVVRHAQQSSAIELESAVYLVVERLSVKALAPQAGTRRVSALNDEAGHDSVKDDPFVIT